MELNIFQEYWERFKRPWCISFSLYLFFIVVILGGLGVIFSIFSSVAIDMKTQHIASNMSTYAIATLVPAIIAIFLSFGEVKNKVSLIISLVIVLLLSVLLLYLSTTNDKYHLICAILSVVLALFFWIIANHDNEKLNDSSFDKKIKEDIKAKHGGNW